MIGFGDVHTRAHIYRAILEGLAYALRQGKERIEKRSGTPIVRLRVAGGGSQSDAAMQLTADISACRPSARMSTRRPAWVRRSTARWGSASIRTSPARWPG